jgi:plastocyanin
MVRLLVVGLLGALAVSLPAAAASLAPSATLQAAVDAGFDISLKNADGTPVTHLDPGSYLINVDDSTNAHNFHLTGPGVNMSTTVGEVVTTQWTVELTNGTYAFQCDAHPGTMRGTFTAGTSPVVPRLSARVTARAISLKTAAGVRVRSIPTNTYKITVSDRTKAQNFHLIGPGINRKTRIAATAKKTWTIDLQPGKYVYRSDKNRKLRGRFTVTSVPPP